MRDLWREAFDLHRATDPDAGWLRAQHLQSVLRLTPAMMAANVADAALVGLAVAPVSTLAFTLWALLLGYAVVTALWGWHSRRGQVLESASPRALRRATLHAAMLGLIWALVPALWFEQLDAPGQLLVGALTTGMMAAGSFALSPLPAASLAFLTPLVLAALFALARVGEPLHLAVAALLVVFALICAVNALSNARKTTALLRAERHAARQHTLVAVLLRDFEESATEALWETDADGRLRQASARLQQLLHGAVASLPGRTLSEVLLPAGVTSSAALERSRAALAVRLEAGEGFRDLDLEAEAPNGRVRFWRIAGKPVLDTEGRRTGWRGVLADVTAEIASERRLRRLAHFDSLTGLANRITLHEAIDQVLRGSGGALMMIDLDRFKAINDTLGHSTGDALLVAVAQRLQQLVRPGDMVARLGGDEFAVLVRSPVEAATALALAQRLVDAFAAPCPVQGRLLGVGLSIGVVLAPAHARGIDELVGNADLALYAAKEAGGQRAQLYAPPLGESKRRRSTIEQALQDARDGHGLRLVWQPQVDLRDGRVVAAEALLRWRHPVLGEVGPAEFVAIAEQTGCIVEIGQWVLRQACHLAVQTLPALRIAVNVSPAQLRDPGFVHVVQSALHDSGLEPQRLEIELTENLFLEDAQAAERLRPLQALGVRIALDDFGTGYSSLAYLRRFPFDTLKIDRSFVRELADKGDVKAIVGAMIDLAHRLGIRTVAEGVETESQWRLLAALGCQEVQGYLVARPQPAHELRRLGEVWRPPEDAPSLLH